ncbi:MAG: hypothetical protein ACM30H_03820 [Clostridia bacterium]
MLLGMEPGRGATILIVSLPGNLDLVAPLFRGHANVQCAADHDTAVRLCAECHPDVVLVGYHFDHMRPYRVIHALRDDGCLRGGVFILFCMLPTEGIDLDGAKIREAYRGIGCEEFIDLRQEASENGAGAALATLRQRVLPYLCAN